MYTVVTGIEDVRDFKADAFGAVSLALSVGVEQTNHLMILIYIHYFVGNVSDCGNHPCRNSAFDDRHL